MNPKSMPRQQLLGEMDMDTREWSDGVLTDAARKVVKEPNGVRSWIICDGDIDPEWIESLNSVLDDNHLLTLPNGERISFEGNVNFLFETHDLRFASPATVSRMGMIFLSDEDMNASRLVSKWLLSQSDVHRPDLETWLDDLFFRALDFVVALRSFIVQTTIVGTILSGLSSIFGVSTKRAFIVGLIQGLGGNLSLPDRSCFAREVFLWAKERPVDQGAPLDCDVDESGKNYISYNLHCGDIAYSAEENPSLKTVVKTVSTEDDGTIEAMDRIWRAIHFGWKRRLRQKSYDSTCFCTTAQSSNRDTQLRCPDRG
jgi:dynein heavy chain 2